MELLIDPTLGTVQIARTMEELKIDRAHDLPDFPDYQVVLRAQSRTSVLLHVTTRPKPGSKRKIIQRGRIQLLSATAGRESHTGNPLKQRYTVRLHPEKPIWPITGLVDQLTSAGVSDWQISPMDENFLLQDNSAAHSDPHMLTDGQLMQTPNPGRNPHGFAAEDLLPSVDFVVRNASWAILHYPSSRLSGGISHIYLWPNAADKTVEIMNIVRQLQANKAATAAAGA